MNLTEKVLQGLKCCTECKGESCRKCPYAEEMPTDTPMCMPEMAADCNKVIKQLQKDNQRLDKENQKLLEKMAELNRKEQARKPADVQRIRKDGAVIGWCEECGSMVIKPDKRCRECGQAQDWTGIT